MARSPLAISETEAIRKILEARGRFASYLGAGTSIEAGVKSAVGICEEIRAMLARSRGISLANSRKLDSWAARELNWSDLSLQYVTCIEEAFQTPADRVEYFRKMLKGIAPSFAHHATVILMTTGIIKRTCITTNFDKLIEQAFALQGEMECQPIRTTAELKYWREREDHAFALKLHGDYDTQNILNTSGETTLLDENWRNRLVEYLKHSGLFVVGTAGYEKSIYTLFDYLGEA